MAESAPAGAAGERRGYRGYCTHRDFNGLRVPVPLQNLAMRDYAARHGLVFRLSVNELNAPGCSLQLFSLLDTLPALEGVLMCSVFMLPASAADRRRVYDALLAAGASLHAVLDSLVVRTPADVDRVEEILRIGDVLGRCPAAFPADLLPPIDPALSHSRGAAPFPSQHPDSGLP